jgi:N-succinyldiaminopimelate aminotransferase
VNPDLAKLHPYPFERLRLLFKDITPDPRYSAINLGIGEPKHPTPEFIRQALTQNLSGLASYPATAGTPALREAIAAWARHRRTTNISPARCTANIMLLCCRAAIWRARARNCKRNCLLPACPA